MSLENTASMSVIAVYIIPSVLYYYTRNPREIMALLGAFGTGLASEGIKHLVIGERNPRPQGAYDCDLICMNGLQEGKPGMPSGHAAVSTFFAAYYFSETSNVWVRLALVVFAASVMYSRYTKRCHSAEQLVAGCLFGLIMCAIMKEIV